MLKNFWYGLATSSELGDEPMRLKALGQNFVLFRRKDGSPQLLSDLCTHRGGALSGGWVKDDCIVCPYHGWEFSAEDGACTKIPANDPGTPIPKTARVDRYPTVEQQGIIFGFLGDLPEEERPPLPTLPYLDDPAYRRVEGQFTWNAHVDRVLENGMDLSHTPFVHGGSFGNKDKPQITRYDVTLGEWQGYFESTLEPPQPSGLWKKLYPDDRPPTDVQAGYWFPNLSILKVMLPVGDMIIYNLHVPVDDHTTISKWINLRTFFTDGPKPWLEIADRDAARRVTKIFKEDQKVVEEQRPELLPLNLADELHIKSDRISVEYRKMRQQAIENGWLIDTHRVQSGYSTHSATVIPSPTRREVPELAKAWLHKEVPMRGASNGNGEAVGTGSNLRPDYDTPEKALARKAAAEEKAARAKAAAAERREATKAAKASDGDDA